MNAIIKFIGRTSLVIAVVAMSIITVGLIATPAHIATAQGPTLPYNEVMAADSAYSGTHIDARNNRFYPGLANEAIGKQAVTLSGQGQYVEFTVPASANSIVLRYSVPDSADGTGLTAPLSLYINGARQSDLTLTSKYAWFYGGYPFNNNPSDVRPHHFYDEVHRLVGQMNAGDKVRVQVDAGDNSPSYTINLMDFEQVAPAAGQPSGSLSITTDFGADASGNNDSTTAIQNAVNSASSQGKVLWIPQGTFKISTQILINNVTIKGAGIWYSQLHFITPTGNSEGLYGNYAPSPSQNVHLSDFAILGEVVTRNDNDQINGIGGSLSNSTINNLWIEHTKCGMWLDGPFDHLTITNVRIRDTNADGVNFHKGVTFSTVTQSFLRNTGDDGLAVWSDSNGTSIADSNDTFSFNRVEIPVLANGIALYGGTDNSITDNYVGDQQAEGGGIHVGNRFSPVTAVSGTINILRNTIVRSGSEDYYNGWNFGTGALWFFALDQALNATINVNNNTIIDSNYEAIHFIGGSVTNVNFNNDTIIGTGTYAVEVRANAGSATFTNVTATGLGRGGIFNCGQPFTIIDGGGNSSWLSTPNCVNPYPNPVYGPIATNTPAATFTPCPPVGCPTNPPTLTPSKTLTPSPTATNSPTPSPIPGTVVKAIDAGGAATGNWVADTNFDQGNQFSDTSTNIDTSGFLDTNPAPQAVYQTVRWNATFTYTIPGLIAGANYTVLLHWAELSFQAAGSRKFNVAINGTNVLTSFDVFAAAGFKHAIAKAFSTTANGSGQIVIAFTQGGADNPFINGIEIISPTGATTVPTNTPTFVPATNTPTTGPTNTPSKTNTPLPTATTGGTDGTPFSGTAYAIPGKVEAENFNLGGEGVAYHDSDAANNGGQYRTSDGVDIEGTSDAGGGFDIGWSNAGEWMKYTVNVASSGKYNFDFRVASNITGGLFHMEVDNVNVTGSLTGPNTGGWQTWTDVFANNINLTAGQHIFKLFTDAGGANYNWFNVTAASTATATPTTAAQQLIVAIDAGGGANGSYIADADFDSGNQFSDTSTAISTSAGLDSNPAPQGVYQTVRWNANFTYTIPNLLPNTSYTVRLHWAELTWTAVGQRKFNVAINGTNVLSAFDVFAAAGNKQAISKSFTATANGSGQIAIAFTQGGADNPFINGIEILR